MRWWRSVDWRRGATAHPYLARQMSDHGFRQNPQGSNTGVRTEIIPPAYPCLTASPGSKTTRRTTHGTGDLYWFRPPLWCNTLLQCVVWWIASGADDEQYKGKNSLARGVLELVRSTSWVSSIAYGSNEDSMRSPYSVVASPIYRGPGPLPKY